MFEIPSDLRRVVIAAAQQPRVRSAVQAVYTDLAELVDVRKPRCDLSGRCCNFEQFGHSLFVTTMELATFVHGLESQQATGTSVSGASRGWDGSGCPFQMGKLCGVHPLRPFGCRIFFCDPTSTDWQQSLYALMHDRLRKLHGALDIPYYYVEWRKALIALGLADEGAAR